MNAPTHDYFSPALKKWLSLYVLKARLRDWLFADYKWITRAEVQRAICALRWQYRDSRGIQKILLQLQETIR